MTSIIDPMPGRGVPWLKLAKVFGRPVLCSALLILSGDFSGVVAQEEAAPVPAVAEAEVARQIEQLGSEEYVLREAAGAKLLRMGISVEGALIKATSSSDREVRIRAARILEELRSREFARRLKAFFNAPVGSKEVTFPAWEAFQKDFGDTRTSRALFAAMQTSDGPILDLYGSKETRVVAGVKVQERLEDIQRGVQAGRGAEFSQILTLYWIATDKSQRLSAGQVDDLMNMANYQVWDEQQRDEEVSAVAKKLLGRVILRAESSKRYTALSLSAQYNLPEGLIPAQQMIEEYHRNSKAVNGIDLRPAVLVISQLGNRTHVPLLESLLDDSRSLGSTDEANVHYTMQQRDLALAGILILTKQRLSDYFDFPMTESPPKLVQTLFQPRYIGFSTDARRDQAIKKWRESKNQILATQ